MTTESAPTFLSRGERLLAAVVLLWFATLFAEMGLSVLTAHWWPVVVRNFAWAALAAAAAVALLRGGR